MTGVGATSGAGLPDGPALYVLVHLDNAPGAPAKVEVIPCSRCFALVGKAALVRHGRWHARIDRQLAQRS